MHRHPFAVLLLCFGVPLICETTGFAERQQYIPTRLDKPPVLDGKLDEHFWRKVDEMTLLPCRKRDEGIPATIVQIAYDDEAVYLGFTCIEPDRKKLQAGQPGRGRTWQLDSVEFFLDVNSDKKSYFQLGISAGGAWMANRCDVPKQARPIRCPFEVKTSIGTDRYSIEVRIPFAFLAREGADLSRTWNVAFSRYRRAGREKGQLAVWKGYQMEGKHHQPETWGDLGPFHVDMSRWSDSAARPETGPGGWTYVTSIPKTYTPHYPKELAPSLAWIPAERLRISYGWMNSAMKYIDNRQHQHDFQEVVDVLIPAGFNVIVPTGGGGTRSKKPYHLMASLDGMLRVRRAGARTAFSVGAVWNRQYSPKYVRRYVSPAGKRDQTMACPLEPYPWRENVVKPALDALDEAKRLGADDLFFAVWFDMERQASMGAAVGAIHQMCYCDHCWSEFAKRYQNIPPDLTAGKRHEWLLLNEKIDDYKTWQKQAVTDLVRREFEPIRKRKPNMVFGFYPFHCGKSWITVSVAKGISTRSAPAILWDDETYWGGYSEHPSYISRTRKATTKALGYEPFYLPSICYAAVERRPDGSPKYPTYTVDRAAREYFLLVKSAAGCIAYGCSRDSNKDLLADQREYHEKGFARANQLLASEGVFPNATVKPPSASERERLDRALAMLQKDVQEMWGNVHGRSERHEDVQTKGGFSGSPTTVTKRLTNSLLPNTTGADYVFDLDLQEQPGEAMLVISGTPRRHHEARTNLLVKVNGKKVVYLPAAFGKDGHTPARVKLPLDRLGPKTVITLAYFLGDSYAETRMDNHVRIDRLTLDLE